MFLITSSFKLSGEISCLFTASIWQATKTCMLPTAFDFPEYKSRLCFGIEDPKVFLRVAPTMHSFYPSKPGTVVGRGVGGGVVKAFQQFCGRECLKIFLEGILDGKGASIFGGEVRDFRDYNFYNFYITNYNFYITNPIWLTIYMQTERCCIACYFSLTFLAYFVLLNYLLIVFALFY